MADERAQQEAEMPEDGVEANGGDEVTVDELPEHTS